MAFDETLSPSVANGAETRLPVRVTVERGASGIELDVSYDGCEPPHDLFRAWAALGWMPPTPIPPPRSAIDWTTPDPVSARRYTIRSYPATGRAVPASTTHVTDELVERALAEVRRLGFASSNDVEVTRPATTPSTSFRALVRITTTQPPHAADALESMALVHGGRVQRRQTTFERQVTYRGSKNTVSSSVVEMTIDIDRQEMQRVLEAAADHGLTPAEVIDLTDTSPR